MSRVRPLTCLMMLLAFASDGAWASSCRGGPVCAYVSSQDIAFIGRPLYGDLGTGWGEPRAPIVQFEVEEVFKGLAKTTSIVWVRAIDGRYLQGSHRYLVFATKTETSKESVDAYFTREYLAYGFRPMPRAFDRLHPPPIYLAFECTNRELGDRGHELAGLRDEIDFLRSLRQGKPLPQVYGRVLAAPFWFYPPVDLPVSGTVIRLHGKGKDYSTVAGPTGVYSFFGLAAGTYGMTAERPFFVYEPLLENRSFAVVPNACIVQDARMITTSKIDGYVYDVRGKPLAGVPVGISLMNGLDKFAIEHRHGITDASGFYSITGVPETAVTVVANQNGGHQREYRSPTVTYSLDGVKPETFLLRAGERRTGLKFYIDQVVRRIQIRILSSAGTPLSGVQVRSEVIDHGQHHFGSETKTDPNGLALLACFAGTRYEIEALRRVWRLNRNGKPEEKAEVWTTVIGSQQMSGKIVQLTHSHIINY